ncbi:MAG: hypothetical protein ACPLPW_03770 [bacterium]|jgi:alkylated DNA nucleotide flippase Atl1|nr:MGMT family protein [Caldisericota bacterium]
MKDKAGKGIKWKSRKTWREKLEKEQERKIVPVPEKWQKQYGTGTMLVPRPLDVDSLIRQVPRGELVTISQIRERLASLYGADTCCPLTCGIFLRISAEAAEEDLRLSEMPLDRVTPYWRVIREDGSLIDKFPGNGELQRAYLEEEGHVLESGKKGILRVKNFEKSLHRF